MTLRTDRLFPLAVLALLAGLTFWLDQVTSAEAPDANARLRNQPDFTVDRLSLRQYDETGAIQFSLSAEHMVHYPADETTDVVQPRLSYFGSEPTAHLRAASARVSKDGKVVVLRDEVVARREPIGQGPELTAATSVLTVIPEQGFAVTDAPVRIVQGSSVITGVGMELNNKQATAVLKSHVRATIQPKRR
jgi:lipopolysaccharide export system protein LptC